MKPLPTPEDAADLSGLHDIVVPDAISWWPLAAGVQIVLALALVVLAVVAWRYWRSWQANAYRREALRELAVAETAPAIAEILRRTALATSAREAVAALHGKSWTDWLAARSSVKMPQAVSDLLAGKIYEPAGKPAELTGLREFATRWISQHEKPC